LSADKDKRLLQNQLQQACNTTKKGIISKERNEGPHQSLFNNNSPFNKPEIFTFI